MADEGDDPIEAITAAVTEHGVAAAQITAVGGFQHARLGYFDRACTAYEPIEVEEQVEVLSLLGDLASGPGGEPALHVHAVLGWPNGSTVGGHVLVGDVWPTLRL